jgi:hypothetical protein
MKNVVRTLAILTVFLSSAAIAQPYAVVGFASMSVTADQLRDRRTLTTLGVGYSAGQVAAEAACNALADCSISGVGSIPVFGGFSLIGKAGLHYVRGNVTDSQPKGSLFVSPARSSRTQQQSASWSGWAAGVGLGAEYAVNKAFAVRAMLEQTGRVGPLDRSRSLSASLLYAF